MGGNWPREKTGRGKDGGGPFTDIHVVLQVTVCVAAGGGIQKHEPP